MTQAMETQPTVSPMTGMVQARGLTKAYRMGETDFTVLKGLDFDLQPGEFVAIEGRSGSGKSTLLHILAGLDSVDDGQVTFDGQDYTNRNSKAFIGSSWFRFMTEDPAARLRNRQFGFIFQFYHLLPELDVLENALLAPSIEHSWLGYWSKGTALKKRAAELLEQLGMGHRLHHRPNQLSGGERQRVAIARALMNSPKVLFADEPTGNLDAETGRQIMDVLEQLHRDHGQTIVMVTHDRTLAREADRVLVLKDGKLEPAV
jgi:lipoprotein-releasing system ATP-binding protein